MTTGPLNREKSGHNEILMPWPNLCPANVVLNYWKRSRSQDSLFSLIFDFPKRHSLELTGLHGSEPENMALFSAFYHLSCILAIASGCLSITPFYDPLSSSGSTSSGSRSMEKKHFMWTFPCVFLSGSAVPSVPTSSSVTDLLSLVSLSETRLLPLWWPVLPGRQHISEVKLMTP